MITKKLTKTFYNSRNSYILFYYEINKNLVPAQKQVMNIFVYRFIILLQALKEGFLI